MHGTSLHNLHSIGAWSTRLQVVKGNQGAAGARIAIKHRKMDKDFIATNEALIHYQVTCMYAPHWRCLRAWQNQSQPDFAVKLPKNLAQTTEKPTAPRESQRRRFQARLIKVPAWLLSEYIARTIPEVKAVKT